MPTYEYRCPSNGRSVEVLHAIGEAVEDWGTLCRLAGLPMGDTPSDAAVQKLISAPGLAFPKTNAELKNLGFSKLVRRDKGVYENVTAADGEARYMRSDDPTTMPKLKKRIGD